MLTMYVRNTSPLKSVSLRDRYILSNFTAFQTDHSGPPNHEVAHSPLQRLHLKPTRPKKKGCGVVAAVKRNNTATSLLKATLKKKKKLRHESKYKRYPVAVAFLLFDSTRCFSSKFKAKFNLIPCSVAWPYQWLHQ